MSVDEGPTLRRRRLGVELRRRREAAGLTQEQVSRRFEWHAAKVNRIETARVSVTARDVKDLLILYGVRDDEYCDALMKQARLTRERPWWTEYRDIVRSDSFIALESEASTMRNWESVVIPGLLQTEAYMRALFATSSRLQEVDRVAALRLSRQRRLTGDDPIQLFAVFDESVVHRQIGGANVMAEQLRHLLTVSDLLNVRLGMCPYTVGEHPLLGTSLVVLEFRDAAELDVVYVEGFRRTRHFLKEAAEVDHYRSEFDRLSAACLDHRETVAVIEGLVSEHA